MSTFVSITSIFKSSQASLITLLENDVASQHSERNPQKALQLLHVGSFWHVMKFKERAFSKTCSSKWLRVLTCQAIEYYSNMLKNTRPWLWGVYGISLHCKHWQRNWLVLSQYAFMPCISSNQTQTCVTYNLHYAYLLETLLDLFKYMFV